MKRLGLIARCDHGGLGNLTWEAYRHLDPDVVLAVDWGTEGRGPSDPGRYDPEKTIVTGRTPTDRDVDAFLDRCDVVYTAETAYRTDFVETARARGVDVVVHVMPEFFVPHVVEGARILLPTSWRAETFPRGTPVVPVPINRTVLPFRRRTEARVFYHPVAQAMLDRHGTDLLAQALRYVNRPVKIIFRSADSPSRRLSASVTKKFSIEWLPLHEGPYWESYPEEADVLLLPRRYGGLCLPMNETASLGMPLASLDVAPQRAYPHLFPIPTSYVIQQRIRGNRIPIFQADPRRFARAVGELVNLPSYKIAELSDRADEWAEGLSWERLLPVYERVLRS